MTFNDFTRPQYVRSKTWFNIHVFLDAFKQMIKHMTKQINKQVFVFFDIGGSTYDQVLTRSRRRP